MNAAIAAQCVGLLSAQLISGGVLLLYLNVLKAGSSLILTILSSAAIVSALLGIPIAYAADRAGLKRFGLIGNSMMVLGVGAIIVGGFFPSAGIAVICGGLIINTIGVAFFTSGWFALLSHAIPSFYLGRFFGRLRFSWQLVGIAFFLGVTPFMTRDTPIVVFQILFGVSLAGVLLRSFFYSRIPDRSVPTETASPFWPTVTGVLKQKDYLPFLAYMFLLTFFTSQAMDVLRLLVKKGLGGSDSAILAMSVTGMAGALMGFFIAGRIVDSRGTKPVFIAGHFFFGLALFIFPLRGLLPLPMPILASVVTFLFGLVASMLSIAVTTESFQFCRGENRALSVVTIHSFQTFAAGSAGFLVAGVLRIDALAREWTLLGWTLTRFDTLLLGFGVMVVLLVVSIGLVPSVTRPRTED